jgi:hypothetical protein
MPWKENIAKEMEVKFSFCCMRALVLRMHAAAPGLRNRKCFLLNAQLIRVKIYFNLTKVEPSISKHER